MLKNLFYHNILENLKRRIWPITLFMIVLLLAYPIFLALSLNNANYYISTKEELYYLAASYIKISPWGVILCGICALISAIQGYAYLYDKKKVDMYQSQPVSVKRRFGTIYLNGIFIYAIPYMLSVFLSCIVAVSMHAFSSLFVANAVGGILENLIIFLVIYHVTILAIMLTGHVIVSLLATGVFLFYEIILRLLLQTYYEVYFVTYAGKDNLFMSHIFFSPILQIYQLFLQNDDIWNISMHASKIIQMMLYRDAHILIVLILQCIVTGLLAYLCYAIRPMETAGKAVVFEKAKAPIKIFLVFLAGIFGSIMFYGMAEGSTVFSILGLLIGLILGQGTVEVIFEFDIRAIIKKKGSFLIAVILAGAFYLIFSKDLFGYDHFVPKAENIASTAIQIDFYNEGMHDWLSSDQADDWFDYNYDVLDHMKMLDATEIIKLASVGMGQDTTEDSYGSDYVSCTVKYNMKNGKIIYRTFPIYVKQEIDTLDALFQNTQYKEGTQQFSEPIMDEFLEQASPAYSNGVSETNIFDQDATGIMAEYEKDYAAMSFSDVDDIAPCGTIKLYYMSNGTQNYTSYPVFPSYKNTIQYLKEKQAFITEVADSSSIQSISITNRDVYSVSENSNYVDYPKKTYTDPAQIKQITEDLYDSSLLSWCYLNVFQNSLDVTILGTDNASGYAYNWSDHYMYFTDYQIPDFVTSDLQYEIQQ